MNDVNHLESVISTTNSVLCEHIGMTKQMNIQLVELERKVKEQERKMKRNNSFLMFEIALLWALSIGTIFWMSAALKG
jgi:hypothetical protein